MRRGHLVQGDRGRKSKVLTKEKKAEEKKRKKERAEEKTCIGKKNKCIFPRADSRDSTPAHIQAATLLRGIFEFVHRHVVYTLVLLHRSATADGARARPCPEAAEELLALEASASFPSRAGFESSLPMTLLKNDFIYASFNLFLSALSAAPVPVFLGSFCYLG